MMARVKSPYHLVTHHNGGCGAKYGHAHRLLDCRAFKDNTLSWKGVDEAAVCGTFLGAATTVCTCIVSAGLDSIIPKGLKWQSETARHLSTEGSVLSVLMTVS